MISMIHGKSTSGITSIVERILSSGLIERQDHLRLSSLILSNPKMSDEERRQINRVFDYVQSGRVKLVD